MTNVHIRDKRTLSNVSKGPEVNPNQKKQKTSVKDCGLCGLQVTGGSLNHVLCTARRMSVQVMGKSQMVVRQGKSLACPLCGTKFINGLNLRVHCDTCVKASPVTSDKSGPIKPRVKKVRAENPVASSSRTPASRDLVLDGISEPRTPVASSSQILTSRDPVLEDVGVPGSMSIDTTRESTPFAETQLEIDTVQLEIFKRYGLVVNTRHNIIICVECAGLVEPKRVRVHIMKNHSSLNVPRELEQDLESSVYEIFPNLTSKPDNPTTPVPPVFGLAPPKDGYLQCTSCSKSYCNEKAFAKHPCISPGPHRHTKRTVQRFLGNNQWSWFPVLPNEPPINASKGHWATYAAAVGAQMSASADLTLTVPQNYRVLHQFLYKERWIQQIKGLPHDDLIPLAKYSSKDPTFGNLHKHIHAFLSKAQSNIDSHYLRRLIGTRPGAEHSVGYQRHHFDIGQSAQDKYSRVFAGVLMLCFRSVSGELGEYKLTLPDDIRAATAALMNVLDPPTRAEIDSEDGSGEYIPSPDEPLLTDTEWTEDAHTDDRIDDEDRFEQADPNPYDKSNQLPQPKTSAAVQSKLKALLTLLFIQVPNHLSRGTFHTSIMHYLLLSSLRPGTEWAPASVITQRIAATLFVGRLTMATLLSQAMSDDPTLTLHTAFPQVEQYLQERTEAPMPNLYILIRGLSGLHSAEQGMISFNAPDLSGRSATFGEHTVTLSQLKDLHISLVGEIEAEMDNLLFHDSQFRIPDDQMIHDEPRERKPGYSFVTDSRNSWTRQPSLAQYILNSPSLFKQYAYLDPTGKVQWLPGACAAHMERIYDLQMKLFVALCLTFGEPARGTELAFHLLCNVGGGSSRNVFVMFQIFLLRGSYNKTSHASGTDKAMVRVPLPKIGRLWIQFLVYLRPLFSQWQFHLRPNMHFNSVHYLFAGLNRPVTSYDLSYELARLTNERINVKMNLSTYRQFMAFITSCNVEAFDAAQGATSAAHMQLGHSGQTDREHYGHDARMPEGIDQSIFMSTARVSAVFHILCGHSPELMELLEAGKGPISEAVRIVQSIRQRKTTISVVNRKTEDASLMELNEVADALKRLVLPSIEETTRAVVARSHASVIKMYSPQSAFVESHDLQQVAHVYTHPYVLQKLREFMPRHGPDLGFTNVQQAQVTQLMWEGKRHMAYIAPTGSGKTTPGLLCTKYLDEGKSTLWILPLVAMHEQYTLRSADLNMSCESWSLSTSPYAPPMNILLTIDQSEHEKFRSFTRVLLKNSRLARIIVDEAHLVLTHESFRPIMHLLDWFGGLGVQLVLQTATLPPSLVGRLFQSFGITTGLVCRVATARPNISFNVVRTELDVFDATCDEYRKAIAKPETKRILIFCRTVAETRKYSSALKIPSCSSSIGKDEISRLLAQFRAGTVMAIATTCVLGVALDVPGVTHVLHPELPRDALAFIQEVGRAGRLGAFSPVWSIVILPLHFTVQPAPNPDLFGALLLHQSLLDDEMCRRLPLQVFLDGVGVPCSMIEGNTHLCDVCERKSKLRPKGCGASKFPLDLREAYANPPMQKTKTLPRTTNAELQLSSVHSQFSFDSAVKPDQYSKSLARAHALLKRFSTSCISCWVRGINDTRDHTFQQCQRGLADTVACSKWKAWREGLEFPQGTCFFCGLQQQLNYRTEDGETSYIHAYATEKETFCPYQYTVLPLVFAVSEDANLGSVFAKSHLRGGSGRAFDLNKWLRFNNGNSSIPNPIELLLLFADKRESV